MKNALTLLLLLAPISALAATSTATPPGPAPLGVFGDWTAASYGEGVKKSCYAFTTAQASAPSMPNRGAVMLTVTERKSGRDEVTLSAGYTYPAKAVVTLSVSGTNYSFYTAGQTAFTTSGAALITAFQQGASASAVASAPGGNVTDNFSLAGFSDAYGAITKACP